MRLRTSKYLIRTVLILISFQFIAPAFVSSAAEQESFHFETTLQKHINHSVSLSSVFEKTETENEEERDKTCNVQLLDITVLHSTRVSASQKIIHQHNVSLHLEALTLFDLHCVYLI